MKKISIVGRGTVGCLAVSHFLKWTDYEIDWIYDPLIPTTPVGEGTNLIFPRALKDNLDFDSVDMEKINSTPKLGIWKRNWGKGKDFKHTFPVGLVGIHFNALEFQKYIFDRLIENPKLNIIENNVYDYSNLDSDYVMVCSGSPKSITEDFNEHNNIPVNSAIVFQCPWEYPKFLFSLTFAKKYGWVFGIPLVNRCAIGYVYNSNFCTEEDIKKDVQSILDEFQLTPNLTRSLKFFNYSKKVNFTERICYNGNASFFLEPLEATSTGTADFVNRCWFDYMQKNCNLDIINQMYSQNISDVESMICLHYYSGSVYKTDFWEYAKNLADLKIEKEFKMQTNFSKIVGNSLKSSEGFEGDIGSWSIRSYHMNIMNLGIKEKLNELDKKYAVYRWA